ncbi:MAG: DUF6775 family putative metallopeptidase [Candidatus Omnitrophota bacterium]
MIIYVDTQEKLKVPELNRFIRDNFSLPCEIKKHFPFPRLKLKFLAQEFARLRIKDAIHPPDDYPPLPLEIKNEEGFLKSGKVNRSLVYEGIKLSALFAPFIPRKSALSVNIILTDRLLCTFADDGRLHLRSIICGYPTLISIPGIVEAPAKPREFYAFKSRLMALGLWEQEGEKVRARFKNRFIDYGDPSFTEVIKGLLAQAIFFHMTREPFCPRQDCRLYNSHWQEELIYSQVKQGKFCPRHKAMLRKIRGGAYQ